MLVNVIDFAMHNTTDTFSVPNTEDNYALIAANRFTRQIKFVQKFSFLANKEMHAPAFFIETLLIDYLEGIIATEESELFDYDEMVGVY
jgi:hypothetical protein